MEQNKEYHINNSTIQIAIGNILDSQAEDCIYTKNVVKKTEIYV